MRLHSITFAFIVLLGCGGTVSDSGLDTTQLDNSSDEELTATGYYYLTARPDLRRCMSPMCGGWFVHRVNYATTKCLDGSWASECYVASTDFSALTLADEELTVFQNNFGAGSAIVRAKIAPQAFGNVGTFGKLVVKEGWLSAFDEGFKGTVYKVVDNGIRCITYPCYSLSAKKLNSSAAAKMLSALDLDTYIKNEERVVEAQAELGSGKPIFVAGLLSTVPGSGPAGDGRVLTGTQLWIQALHRSSSCGGLMGIACADGQYCDIKIDNACEGADMPGVCETVPEACMTIYNPVCGCDGVTYSNDCARLASQTQLAHKGVCP